MKILLYNWVPFDDPKKGGGVTTYLANLVDYLVRVDNPPDVYFLCSGVYYDDDDRSLRIERLPESKINSCKAYAVINSPVMAPAWINFYHIRNIYDDCGFKEIFFDFLRENGPFDVVHFHNLEGLTLSVLQCGSLFPETRFIYTVHNYYAFCPQVNLWRKEVECCFMSDTTADCADCMLVHIPKEKLLAKMAMSYSLVKDYSVEKEKKFLRKGIELDEEYRLEENRRLSESEKAELNRWFIGYRKTFVKILNENMDAVLAVSHRVASIAIKNGIDVRKIRTSYIGTKVASNVKTEIDEIQDGIVSIVYLGYQRYDKGFFFMIDALNRLSREVCRNIDLTIAAKENNRNAEQWTIDEQKFHKYIFFDGYRREDLDSILFGKHLGLVPVLWEDNMPQVALEMVAAGVPILCSDRGGAHELCTDSSFCFHSGDVDDFISKLSYFVKTPDKIQNYYQSFKGLTTMDEHWQQLSKIYLEK